MGNELLSYGQIVSHTKVIKIPNSAVIQRRQFENTVRENDEHGVLVDREDDPNSPYETLTRSDYIICEDVQSRFDPDKKVRRTIGMYCPRCKYMLKCTEHGECTDCPECKLHIITYGNAMIVREKRSWF